MLTPSQIIIGVTDLNAATLRFRAIGFDVLDGGVHPLAGTANRIIPLGAQYLELLGVVSLEQACENEYGRSLLRAISDGDRLVRWSLRTDAIGDVAKHRNGARAVTSLSIAPRDAANFQRWTEDADVPLRRVTRRAPGLWSVGVQTDRGELVISG